MKILTLIAVVGVILSPVSVNSQTATDLLKNAKRAVADVVPNTKKLKPPEIPTSGATTTADKNRDLVELPIIKDDASNGVGKQQIVGPIDGGGAEIAEGETIYSNNKYRVHSLSGNYCDGSSRLVVSPAPPPHELPGHLEKPNAFSELMFATGSEYLMRCNRTSPIDVYAAGFAEGRIGTIRFSKRVGEKNPSVSFRVTGEYYYYHKKKGESSMAAHVEDLEGRSHTVPAEVTKAVQSGFRVGVPGASDQDIIEALIQYVKKFPDADPQRAYIKGSAKITNNTNLSPTIKHVSSRIIVRDSATQKLSEQYLDVTFREGRIVCVFLDSDVGCLQSYAKLSGTEVPRKLPQSVASCFKRTDETVIREHQPDLDCGEIVPTRVKERRCTYYTYSATESVIRNACAHPIAFVCTPSLFPRKTSMKISPGDVIPPCAIFESDWKNKENEVRGFDPWKGSRYQ